MSSESRPNKRPAPDSGDTGSKKKRRRKPKHSAEDDELIDLELGVNGAIAKMDSQLLADHLAQRTSRFGTDLSPVELSDLSISGTTDDSRLYLLFSRSGLATWCSLCEPRNLGR